MTAKYVQCAACGRRIVLAAYQPDLVRTGPPGRSTTGKARRTSYMPLDVAQADPDDAQANYALSVGRTVCHLITADWPLIASETRHTIHFATCPARTAADTPNGAPDDH